MTIICTGLLLVMPISTKAQETAPATAPSAQMSMEGLYFADIVARGQVVFQIGSLSNISASDRCRTAALQYAPAISARCDRSITRNSRRTADYFADYTAGDYD